MEQLVAGPDDHEIEDQRIDLAEDALGPAFFQNRALRLGDRIAILRDGRIIQQGTGEQIVLRPADDYISSFVRDVNRGHVISVRTIMRKGERAETSVTLTATTLLEEAAPAALSSASPSQAPSPMLAALASTRPVVFKNRRRLKNIS